MVQAQTADRNPIYPGKMTFDEFLAWAGKDTHAEWVDGEVVWMSLVSLDNGDITHFLSILLRHYAEHYNLGAVYYERVMMRLATRPSGREPDVIFIAEDRRTILKKNFVDGPADLVVEVVCEESLSRDRQEKFQEYELAGVKEYWIIDPENNQAEFYQLDSGGRYALVPPDENGIYYSTAMNGLWLRVNWLRQNPLPPVLSVLREWKII
jgi:Uma2 family endonuclease